MISPSSRVLERGLDWFFMPTEGCGGGTPDLGFFSGVSVFIRIFGVDFKSGGATRSPQGWRPRPRGVGAPSTLVDASWLFSDIFLYFPKIISVDF